MYVKNTGTDLLTILKEKYNPNLAPNEVYIKVKQKYHLVWLKDVVNQLGGKISEKDMAEMNAKVDLDKQDPRDVVREFLKKKGLINR
jgi:glycine betaine/choline ABC-type transport system substrate-binding protein